MDNTFAGYHEHIGGNFDHDAERQDNAADRHT